MFAGDIGAIRDKNDPQYGDYAEWAQKQYHLNNAKAHIAELDDDNTNPQRREQILDEMKGRGYSEEMMLADREANNIDTKSSVRTARDETQDVVLQDDKSAARNDFMNLQS